MDNINKALLMAGGVLITIMVISVLVYSINSYRSYAERMSAITASSQNESFNRFFTYMSLKSALSPDKVNIRGYDAYNVINKAIDMNKVLDEGSQISISLNGVAITSLNDSYKTNNAWLESYHEYSYSYRK